jgi:predicted RNA-binding Zn-ribbon protein involved in translation (DUF1610 family)
MTTYRCATCNATTRVQPQASAFTCGTCGAANTVRPEARARAMRLARIWTITVLVVAVVITVWLLQQCA